MTLRGLANAVLSAFIAPPCASCGRVLDDPLDGAVCPACWRAIRATASPDSSNGLRVMSTLHAMGLYEGRLRDVIHALKYDGRRSIAPRLSRLMATHAPDALAGADLVVPVPLHRKRLRDRGFNQADDLACGLGLPVCRALRRTKVTRPQVELPAEERYLNVRGAFALNGRHGLIVGRPHPPFIGRIHPSFIGRLQFIGRPKGRPLQGAIIVLVDDVTTTGATLEACAEVLLAAGAREVRGLTAARVVTGRH